MPVRDLFLLCAPCSANAIQTSGHNPGVSEILSRWKVPHHLPNRTHVMVRSRARHTRADSRADPPESPSEQPLTTLHNSFKNPSNRIHGTRNTKYIKAGHKTS